MEWEEEEIFHVYLEGQMLKSGWSWYTGRLFLVWMDQSHDRNISLILNILLASKDDDECCTKIKISLCRSMQFDILY